MFHFLFVDMNYVSNEELIKLNIDTLMMRAKMIAALGTMYGIENKTINEINREAERMILNEFAKILRYYERDYYDLGKKTTIDNVVDDLLSACYKYVKSTGEINVEKEKWKLFFKTIAEVSDRLFEKYMSKQRKINNLSKQW